MRKGLQAHPVDPSLGLGRLPLGPVTKHNKQAPPAPHALLQVLIEAWRGCHHLAVYVSQEVEGLQMVALQRQLAVLEQAAVQCQDMMRHLVTPRGDTGDTTDPAGAAAAAGGGGNAEDLLLLVMEEVDGSEEEEDWEGPAAVTLQDRSQDVQAQVGGWKAGCRMMCRGSWVACAGGAAGPAHVRGVASCWLTKPTPRPPSIDTYTLLYYTTYVRHPAGAVASAAL
jgi:hypothetical protein